MTGIAKRFLVGHILQPAPGNGKRAKKINWNERRPRNTSSVMIIPTSYELKASTDLSPLSTFPLQVHPHPCLARFTRPKWFVDWAKLASKWEKFAFNCHIVSPVVILSLKISSHQIGGNGSGPQPCNTFQKFSHYALEAGLKQNKYIFSSIHQLTGNYLCTFVTNWKYVGFIDTCYCVRQ